MLTLALALAGITVFAPLRQTARMPWISSVGRDQRRSSTEYPFSPISAVEPTSFFVILFVEGQALPYRQFGVGGGFHVVVETGDKNLAIGFLELSDHLGQGEHGIRRRSAIHAGVQIGLRGGAASSSV